MEKEEKPCSNKKSLKALCKMLKGTTINCLFDIRSGYYLKKNSRKKKNGRIKVGFIVQMAEIWDKEEKIYELMSRDERFETFLFVCPAYDLVKKQVKRSYDDTYFLDRYSNAIKLFENGSWLDIKKYDLDYVFYQRPYDTYLPDIYKSCSTVKFTKCCYVPYAFWPFMNDLCGYNKGFFRNVYFAFMESGEHCKAIQEREKDKKRIIYKGYPSLDGINAETTNEFRNILWTPRWSYSDKLGGSHFFEYKEEIIELKRQNSDLSITVRPHPLAFENYIRMGMMTDSDLLSYKQRNAEVGICFDSNKKIEDSFRTTDILITDISSIIFTFFLTEKPIIFCNTESEMSPEMKKLLKGMYVADSWNDIYRYIQDLQNGVDPLKEIRHKLAEKYRKEYSDSAKKIINTLIEDYKK